MAIHVQYVISAMLDMKSKLCAEISFSVEVSGSHQRILGGGALLIEKCCINNVMVRVR